MGDILSKQMEKVKAVLKELMEDINDFIPSSIKEFRLGERKELEGLISWKW